MIGAILRAQWISMRMGGRRGMLLSLITGLIWYGIWSMVAVAAYVMLSKAPLDTLHDRLPIGLLGICIYWQAMPILSASMGSSLDLRKLRIYPAPHGKLFQVEVLLRLTTGGQLDAAQFVTHHFAMHDMLEAYDTFARAADTGALKVVITPTNTPAS